jgi:putative heme transporter
MSATPTADAAARARRTRIIRIAQIGFSVAIVVAIFAYAIPKFASYSAVWEVLRTLTWPQLGLLVAATLFNLLTYWLQLMAALPGLTLGQAAVNNQTTTSIANTVPAVGGALSVGVSYAMLRSWGFSLAAITLMTLLTGIWNAFLKLGMPIVAVALLAITGSSTVALLIPALVGVAILVGAVVVFALLMWKKELARRIGAAAGAAWSWLRRLVRKPPVTGWDEAAVRFRRQSNDLVARRWPALTLTTLVSHLGLYLVFLLTTRLVGITATQVSWVELLGIFSLGRLLTAAPITPGGVGLAEITYIAGLVLAGGNQIRAQAVAAALLFRLLTYGLQIPLGGSPTSSGNATRAGVNPPTPTRRPRSQSPRTDHGSRIPPRVARCPAHGKDGPAPRGTGADPQATRQQNAYFAIDGGGDLGNGGSTVVPRRLLIRKRSPHGAWPLSMHGDGG